MGPTNPFFSQRFIRYLIWGLALVLVAACASSSKEKIFRDPSQSSSIRFVSNNPDYIFLRIIVDGRWLSAKGAELLVPSGKRNISFDYAPDSWWPTTVGASTGANVNLEPDKKYEIHSHVREKNSENYIWTWVVESGTGKVVAGHPEPRR